MGNELPAAKSGAPLPKAKALEAPFGVNEVRLTARQWVAAFGIVLLAVLLTPPLWEMIERFETGPDFRVPYHLSNDYWLFGRWLRQASDSKHILVLGDSVIWGEYVLPDGTLSHFLNRQAGDTNRFVNSGVNGLFPLALEGLIRYYGQSLRHQKVMVQCNVLWMTSPKADLSLDKEEQFNHSRLVPQYFPRIRCYQADANERLSALVERNVSFVAWVGHLQNAYFEQKSIPRWTLADNGGDPPHYPNVYKNPLAQITLTIPCAAPEDPQRGPQSPRHKSWTANAPGPTQFDWVALNSSVQWQAFQRLIGLLRERGNDVMVVLGPFNEHMIAEENRTAYRQLRDGIALWLSQNHIAHVVPETLPSSLYADASHPLTEGYELLARRLLGNERFQNWCAPPVPR